MRTMPAHPHLFTSLLTFAVLLLAANPNAHADAYSLEVVAHTDAAGFYGIDAAGDFAIDWTQKPTPECGLHPTSCYATYYNNGSVTPVYTNAAPNLVLDNGSDCKPAIGGAFLVEAGICNNGHYIIQGVYNLPNNTQKIGIWGGPDPDVVANFLGYGLLDGGFMNSSGDAVYIDSSNDTLVFADDLSTSTVAPEPSSLILIGTGALAFLERLRRRLAV